MASVLKFKSTIGVLLFLSSSVMSYSVSNGLNFQGMEENCILSFVVPRDKMKSSCDVDDKVKRRLNAIEMKVNIYKQQTADLQAQLDKERRFNAEKLEKMERQVRESTASADVNFLVERRLAWLENEFNQLNAEVTMARVKSPNFEAPSHTFNAIDNSPVMLPNLVKSMVQAEVKTVFENFTRKFENYVREQIMVYGQVFNILSKRSQTTPAVSEKTTNKEVSLKQTGRTHGRTEGTLLHEFKKVKADLDKTGEEIAKKVGSFLQQNTPETKANKTSYSKPENTSPSQPNVYADKEESSNFTDSEPVGHGGDGLESNDSFSGENPDSNLTLPEETFTQVVDADIVGGARSRISGGGKGSSNVSDVTRAEREKGEWKENMIGDENYKYANAEGKLKEEITTLLYEPLAKVMGLVEKEAAAMEEKLREHEDLQNKVTKEIDNRIDSLDQVIKSNSLQVGSLSKGFQDAFIKLNKITSLEEVINEIKTNLSSDSASISAHDMDQQNKKMTKLERLMNVYQKSLEHYKNETKFEYKEVRERLTLETLSMKKVAKNLRKDVSTRIDKAIDQMNKTYSTQLRDVKEQIQKNEDNIVYNQIDIENHDIQLNDKKDRTSRGLDEVKDTLSQVISKNRECRKKIDNLQKKHSAMRDKVNVTAKAIEALRKEVQLNLVDSWMKIDFEYDPSISKCYGDKYVRRIKLPNSSVKLVGVVLCSADRYKILMSNSLHSTFLNIGDGKGLGQDHCEFVGAKSERGIKLGPYTPSYIAIEGYTRNSWGQVPKKSVINPVKPSPPWYECGVSIP